MKFLCDRCKTRYSIGDDRVRGKILKIRCKNCGNVITVREGMVPEPDAVPPPEYAGRTKPTTTTSPAAHEERAAEAATVPARPGASSAVGRAKQPVAAKPAAKAEPASAGSVANKLPRGEATFGQPEARAQGGRREDHKRAEPANALNAAFASAMAKPPPALEEEWYVSIDGVQSGPFSLAEAQRWVGQKPFDAELHCWSEGFDDWLPVDKVSHFRGLRKRPVPAVAPPPLPRASGSPRPVVAAQAAPVTLPEEPSKPLFAATMATLERAAPVSSSPAIQLPPPGAMAPTSARATPAHGVHTGNGANGTPRVEDTSLAPEPRLMPRPDARPDAWAKPQPVAEPARPAQPYSDPFAQIDRAEGRAAQGTPSTPASDFAGGDSDGDLHIGEVSRVVNLADLARTPKPNPAPARRAQTAAVGRLTNANPVLRSTSSVASLPGTGAVAAIDGAPPVAAEGDPALTMAPVAKSHRRGLIALLSVAMVLVLGGAVAVVLFVNNDTLTGGGLGPVHDIDTSRPDDPTHRTLPPGTTAPVAPTNPFIPRPPPRPRPITPTEPGRDPDPPPGGTLRGEEIEDMARKHQDMTQRCYMRSQRGADSILVGDVKKITVTLTIDRDGSVTDVGLSEHAADNLGKCLISSMKTWKFRVSAGGAFRISLNFVNG